MFHLNGKSALVTGSGRGIGLALAKQLSAAGARVMMNDLDAHVLAAASKEVPNSAMLAGDVTQADFPGQLVNATLSHFGSLDIIVNNAGYTWDNVIQKTTDEQFQAMLDIHLLAPFRILRAASDWLRTKAKEEAAAGQRLMRKVVNITSISGVYGNAGQIGYAAGKSGINGMTQTLAKEWGRYNINVNSVGFGFIETRLIAPLDENELVEVQGRQVRVGVQRSALESMKALCPLGRFGTPEEAANSVLFFCSPLSDYVTGEVLICSGGARF
jgi:3-oxoacyl-[acyl-carrier protein] reductase